MRKLVLYGGRVHTAATREKYDSLAIADGQIAAVGRRLEHDPGFRGYSQFDLKGRTVVPGLVDAHTHFYQLALKQSHLSLDGVTSMDACLRRIKKFASSLPGNRWLVGFGFFPESFSKPAVPNRHLLDEVTGSHPAFIFYKDTHSAWVNTRALKAAGITADTPDPEGGSIEREEDGTPSGIFREVPAYLNMYRNIPAPPLNELEKSYRRAVDDAYFHGIVGVHSFDGPEGFDFFERLAERNKLGLRVNYYAPAAGLDDLEKAGIRYGFGNDYLRIAGVKLFADGALGSQTALCFNKYAGSRDNYGIAVMTVAEMTDLIRRASRLGLPSAVHAIGDKAVSNVLDAIEQSGTSKLRHRIEHVQLMRRKDISRLKKLGVVASMQPSHCPADIDMVRRYWGSRGRNAYIFRTLFDRGVPLAFGSDAPIEPVDPIAGIAAAVRRAHLGSRDVFYPEQRIFAGVALHAFTAGAALACGQERTRGCLLPGYPADFVILDRDPTRVAPMRLYDLTVLATFIDGYPRYAHSSLKL